MDNYTEFEKREFAAWEAQLRKAELWDTGVFLFFLIGGLACVGAVLVYL